VQSADLILAEAASVFNDRETGQAGLFGASTGIRDQAGLRLVATDDWPMHERLSEEFSAIGFYLSGHPLDAYDKVLKRIGVTRYADLLADARRTSVKAKLAGTVIRRQERRGRSGDPFAFVGLSDPSGMFEIMVFSEALSQARSFLEAGRSVVMMPSGYFGHDSTSACGSSYCSLVSPSPAFLASSISVSATRISARVFRSGASSIACFSAAS